MPFVIYYDQDIQIRMAAIVLPAIVALISNTLASLNACKRNLFNNSRENEKACK